MKRLILLGVLLVLLLGAFAAQACDGDRYIHSPAALGNVFGTEYGIAVWRYYPEHEQAFFSFAVTYEEIELAHELVEATGENILLAHEGDITMWVLTSGECQVNSPHVDGHVDENVFGC